MSENHNSGTLFIISAPSGAGKTSLVKALLEDCEGLSLSISHTTRNKRPGEEHGRHYYFVTKAEFEALIQQEAFLEYAQVFDNYYGTTAQSVRDQLQAGRDMILEIDWQGARQVREVFPEAVSIFILPPSLNALRERLSDRGQDDAQTIERRMQDAVSEISHYGEFDYLIINDKFDCARQELKAVIIADRQRRVRQSARYRDLLDQLV